jgi:4-hydroxy-3-polyprenylbenzoate decarboxylase
LTPLVLGISGASGAPYSVRMLHVLRSLNIPVHLIISKSGAQALIEECGLSVAEVRALATVNHSNNDLGAAVGSGFFASRGMIIVPCSIRTLSDIAYGTTDTLLSRAANVTLKERRRLVLVVRETPLHLNHLRSMVAATEKGAVIVPPAPAFYPWPQSVDEIIAQTVGRCLELFDIHGGPVKR